MVKDEVKLNNEVITPNRPSVISFTKNIIQAKARGELYLPNLPTKAKIAHTIPVAQNLFLLAVQANNNMVSILEKSNIIIFKADAIQITLTEPPGLIGQQTSNGL